MALSNFERLDQLADEIFDVKNDPDQLSVDETVLERLLAIHPASLATYETPTGPAAWILVIPTTHSIMEQFINGTISERELYDQTEPGMNFQAIYLCSALLLDEFRGKGIATQLTVDAVNAIRKDHAITELFVWPFSEQGDKLAVTVAQICRLPLRVRN